MTHGMAGLMPDAESRHPIASLQDEQDGHASCSGRRATWLMSIQTLSSSLLRLMVYVFLRWIPTSIVVKPIPIAYLLYLGAYLLNRARSHEPVEQNERAVESVTANSNPENPAVSTPSQKGTAQSRDAKAAAAQAPGNCGRRGVLVKRKRRIGIFDALFALLFGSLSSSSTLNKLVLLLNTLAFAWFADSVLSPIAFPSHWEHHLHFFRTGAIGPTFAKLHIRYPFPFGESAYSSNESAPITSIDGLPVYTESDPVILSNPEPMRVIYREALSNSISSSSPSKVAVKEAHRWERGPLLRLTPDSDWTATAQLSDLWPATEYEWSVVFAHNHTRPREERVQRFVTFPDPMLSRARAGTAKTVVGPTAWREDEDQNPLDDPNHFTFATSSCVKPDFPWNPSQFILWHWLFHLFGYGRAGTSNPAVRNRIQGFDMLADRAIESRRRLGHPALRFFMSLGDTIYADVPVWGGANISKYRNLYRNLFASQSFRRVYEKIPVIGIYDDHEAKNNWSGGSDDEDIQAAIPVATQSWQEYIGGANPDNTLQEGTREHWYTFRYGDTAFFVMDVRKHRTSMEHEDNAGKQVLGDKQKVALFQWLSAVNSSSTTFKFIVSSVPFTSLWGGKLDVDGSKDSWAAYLTERDELLEVMHYVPNVIVLSGDRHEFAATALAKRKSEEEENESYTLWPVTEFSTSPLNMFYLPIRTLGQENGRGATGQEKLLKYIPDGNVKWTEFEVDTRDHLQPIVRATVMVDGKEAWRVDIVGKPVVSAPKQAVGGLAKTLLELLGFKSRKWF
ncbi:hypothetical protein K437DRAFT_64978 [Tilletiaria anomala UBC 951]|uniref:PhoD-like phosphatase metallophosphatase domain-containing protein n=1 Tax=Tilletiaria anomala (strain ATCC 24038 / CBS 436.72 / UBC 951) TaxID=1037660 RepID=A0A066WCX5_TILAU|nr:uncharacterized protein K437DRAFT_64978 [Tilletiaria anomala UBC 951]KDN50353.1 hypothetical protein K437DRAFT_64978 [Tilletiaria anomala UBC 951]